MTREEALELLDDMAADDPLTALREYPECLSPYRLDACATAEPEAALIHVYDRLTPERQAYCTEAARRNDLRRFRAGSAGDGTAHRDRACSGRRAMSAPDTVTIARAHDPKVVMAKIVHLGGYGIIDVEPSGHAFIWAFEQIAVDGLASLAQAVQTAAADPYAVIVRAEPLAPIGRRAMYDEPDYGEHAAPGLKPVPRRWVGFDCDNIQDANTVEDDPAEQANWDRPPALFMPWVGAEIARKRLPPEFRTVRCLWQVTGSAGFKPGYRLRLWHWLDQPTTGEELQTWIRPAIERNLIDPATLRECQEHFIGVKVVGGRDPCPARYGFLDGATDTVKVPDIAGIKRRQDEAERKERQQQQPKTATKITGPELAQRRIADCINKLKAARDGTKHLVYVDQCAAAKYICDEFKLDCWPQVRRDLAAVYEASLPAGEADRRRRGSIEGVPNWVERRAS
jgi:hypothetical protein